MRRSRPRAVAVPLDRAPADVMPLVTSALAALALGLAAALVLAAAPAGAQAAGDEDGVVQRDADRDWAVGRPLPQDADWAPVDDWERHGLPAPQRGERYVRYDGEVLRVTGTPEAGLIVLRSEGEAAGILE